MKDKINEEIETIKNNINILPKKNKQQRDKCNEYIDREITKFSHMKKEAFVEINRRTKNILNKYKYIDTKDKVPVLDLLNIKYTNEYIDNMEKMNLYLYLYKLNHFYNNDLEDINIIIYKILDCFKTCGIILKPSDFIISSYVNKYMTSILSKKPNMHELFESIYWEAPNIMFQIEINFRYLYFKYEKIINKYFTEKYSNYNVNSCLDKYIDEINRIEVFKHNDKNYLFSQLVNNDINLNDYQETSISSDIKKIILEKDENTYNNLIKLFNSISAYKEFQEYSYIIDDIKELFKNHDSYKDEYNNKLKEISKNEKELLIINNKLNKTTGLFKISETKRKELKSKQNTLIESIINLYHELDDISIHNVIFKYINEESSYLDALKIICFNFTYFKNLYKKNDKEVIVEEIIKDMNKLAIFVYAKEKHMINNIHLFEEKDLPMIIRDRYRLVNLIISEENLSQNGLDDIINKINKIIKYYDIKNNKIDLLEINYILDAEKTTEKENKQ